MKQPGLITLAFRDRETDTVTHYVVPYGTAVGHGALREPGEGMTESERVAFLGETPVELTLPSSYQSRGDPTRLQGYVPTVRINLGPKGRKKLLNLMREHTPRVC